MFFKQLYNFNVCVSFDRGLARVNVQLEQSAYTFNFRTLQSPVASSLAVVVDRVLIDAVQRTQQLARARAVVKSCAVQRRPTYGEKKRFFLLVMKNKDQ